MSRFSSTMAFAQYQVDQRQRRRPRSSSAAAFIDTHQPPSAPSPTPTHPNVNAHAYGASSLTNPVLQSVCAMHYRPTYQVASAVTVPGVVAEIEKLWEEEDELEEYKRKSNGRRRFEVGHGQGFGLDVRDRLGLFVMVCSALVGVQAMLPKGL